jgi:hypothetical protein
MRRDLRGKSADKLNAKLFSCQWNCDIDQVQDYWNSLEKRLVEVADKLALFVPLIKISA